VDADRGVEVGIGRAHDRSHRSSCRHPSYVHPAFGDLVVVYHLSRDARNERRFAPTALLVRNLEPVPALLHVGVACLSGIRDEECVLLGEFVHAGARSEVVRVLGATV
jgi:hypothetical protein